MLTITRAYALRLSYFVLIHTNCPLPSARFLFIGYLEAFQFCRMEVSRSSVSQSDPNTRTGFGVGSSGLRMLLIGILTECQWATLGLGPFEDKFVASGSCESQLDLLSEVALARDTRIVPFSLVNTRGNDRSLLNSKDSLAAGVSFTVVGSLHSGWVRTRSTRL